MRWKKIDRYDYDQQLKELGCPRPNSSDHYSYGVGDLGIIHEQPCVDLFTTIKPHAAKKYRMVQHYSIETECKEATHVLCRRDWHNYKSTVTRHLIGACPLCIYHTAEEYFQHITDKFGERTTQIRRKLREARLNAT